MKKRTKFMLLFSCALFCSQFFFSCNPPREPDPGDTARQQQEEGLRIFRK
ncbi:hypothetical protein EDD80_10248 [Anseongella ginsenosidimutans]|uniref:Lipoprotein n=1 Tax=Anseongella ginsenosidimutans TaxID=496056 RepID=A0A4R3KUQ3_9SPHI|nr:hypothetical protein EDD80_10248 [Anseongella ginsenosidimutans]